MKFSYSFKFFFRLEVQSLTVLELATVDSDREYTGNDYDSRFLESSLGKGKEVVMTRETLSDVGGVATPARCQQSW